MMTSKNSSPALLCPLCKKPRHHEFRPFCSARCKQIDLNRWFSEIYSVPVQEEQNPTESQEEEIN